MSSIKLGDDKPTWRESPMQAFFKNESGATAIEYALIAALIAVAIITGAQTLGNNLDTKLTEIGTAVDTAGDGAAAAE